MQRSELDGCAIACDPIIPDHEWAFKIQPGNAIVYLPFMTLMELEYQSLRRFGRGETRQILGLVSAWPVEIAQSTGAWRHEAATVKATTPLSVADAWICGLARLLDAELVYKDPEYDVVPELQALQLPYKPKTR